MSSNLPSGVIQRVCYLCIWFAFLLSSCTGGAGPLGDSSPPDLPEGARTAPETAVEPRPDSEAVPPALTANPSPEEPAAETPSPEPGILPTVRADLHATDPNQVSLVSGKPQLIEFFAFW